MNIKRLFQSVLLLVTLLSPLAAFSTPPVEDKAGIRTVHLDEYNGYFAAQETLAGLKPGKYRFVVTNKADKLVGFLLQDGVTHEKLDMFPLEPGESRTIVADIGENGFRYRCPINPTPWYDVSVTK